MLLHRLTSFVQNEKLKLENHFFEMITATVSHDMRTPINAITGLMLALETYIYDQRGKYLLEIMSNSAKSLLYLVNDLLDFFKMKHGKFEICPSPSDIRIAMEEMRTMFDI